MKAADVLNQAAEVLEKTAAFLDGIESKQIAEIQAHRTKTAQKLADKIAAATGETLAPELTEKLSSMGPEIQDILGRLTDGGTVDPLGDADDNVKLAGVTGAMSPADARFLAWLQS
jgi:inactivated superfamily I helicase